MMLIYVSIYVKVRLNHEQESQIACITFQSATQS